jgi:hypothetical protein
VGVYPELRTHDVSKLEAQCGMLRQPQVRATSKVACGCATPTPLAGGTYHRETGEHKRIEPTAPGVAPKSEWRTTRNLALG